MSWAAPEPVFDRQPLSVNWTDDEQEAVWSLLVALPPLPAPATWVAWCDSPFRTLRLRIAMGSLRRDIGITFEMIDDQRERTLRHLRPMVNTTLRQLGFFQ